MVQAGCRVELEGHFDRLSANGLWIDATTREIPFGLSLPFSEIRLIGGCGNPFALSLPFNELRLIGGCGIPFGLSLSKPRASPWQFGLKYRGLE